MLNSWVCREDFTLFHTVHFSPHPSVSSSARQKQVVFTIWCSESAQTFDRKAPSRGAENNTAWHPVRNQKDGSQLCAKNKHEKGFSLKRDEQASALCHIGTSSAAYPLQQQHQDDVAKISASFLSKWDLYLNSLFFSFMQKQKLEKRKSIFFSFPQIWPPFFLMSSEFK